MKIENKYIQNSSKFEMTKYDQKYDQKRNNWNNSHIKIYQLANIYYMYLFSYFHLYSFIDNKNNKTQKDCKSIIIFS